jgi:hypothetical protein
MLENSLPKVPAHLVSLAGERVVRMRVDPSAETPLACPVPVSPAERLPFATVDLASLRSARAYGVAPE